MTAPKARPDVAGEDILRGMVGGRLYVAGDCRGRPIWDHWFLTGPTDRSYYLTGPFPQAVVTQLVQQGAIEPDVIDEYGAAHQYRITNPKDRP